MRLSFLAARVYQLPLSFAYQLFMLYPSDVN